MTELIGGDLPELYDVWWLGRDELTIRGVTRDVAESEAKRLKREADDAGYQIGGEPYRFEVRPHDPHRFFEGGIFE